MELEVNFDNPEMISRGKESDKVRITISEQSKQFFVSKRTGKAMENSKEGQDDSMMKSIPIQLPTGIKEEEVREQA